MDRTISPRLDRRRWRTATPVAAIALLVGFGWGCDESPRPGRTTPSPAPTSTAAPTPAAASTSGSASIPAPATAAPLSGLIDEQGFRRALEEADGGELLAHGEVVPIDATGYLSLPEAGEPPFDAVVVVHGREGLTATTRLWTDRLAAVGYAALAVDLYDGALPTDGAAAERAAATLDERRALDLVRRSLHFVRRDRRVGAASAAVLGLGSGASWALRAALDDSTVAAVVLYGGAPPADAARLAALDAPLLALRGTGESREAASEADRFEMGLEQAGSKSYRVHRYDAPERFYQPSGPGYEGEAAAAAWQAARRFLAEHLRAAEPGEDPR